MSVEILDVWVGEKRVGQLTQEDYTYHFQYEDIASLDPHRDLVSLTMPIRSRQYETQTLMPPFQMALPEGALLENLRTRFAKVMDINNDILLLKLIGNHTIGRVRFTEPNAPLQTSIKTEYALKDLLSYPETEDLFKELIEQLAPQSGIAGVQPKLLWTDEAKKISLTEGQYILKSAGRDYFGLAVNEFFCLKIARACGLTTPNFHLTESAEMLVVERFDKDKNGHQLAFEECCALLRLSSHGKYNSSYEAVANLIEKTPCKPLTQARRDFFKSIVLSMLLRNGDAHLKNFGILYNDTAHIRLAPIYDLVNTLVYIPKDVPALTLAGKKQWPDIETLINFGLVSCGLRKKTVKQCLEEVHSGVIEIQPLIKKFAARHRAYRALCERMNEVIKTNLLSYT